VDRLLAAAGRVLWIEREELMDAVTAVSGSGPAYVFYLLEAMEQAALELGFDARAARLLSLETVLGAARLAAADDTDPAVLRARVTSRGGTTERAIGVLEAAGVRQHFVDAIKAAAERSRELGDALGAA
jgi:pyrroline-5-carboxylate reductase